MSEILFPKGTLRMYGQGAINTSVGQVEAARQAANFNTLESLGGILKNPDNLLNYHIPDGTNFSFIRPTGPYTPRATMLAAYSTNLEQLTHTTQLIYDLSPNAQQEYWRLVVNGLQAMQNLTKGDSDTMVLYAENAVSAVTSEKHRTSRTLTPTHGHFLELDKTLVIPEHNNIDHLLMEQRFLRTRFAGRLIDAIGENLELTRRMIPPFGYTFESASTKPAVLQRLMLIHHSAYSSEAELYLAGIENIPSPSYRLYGFLQGKTFKVIIAPEVLSHAGVMEAAGIRLERSEQHPKIYSDEEVEEFRQSFVNKLFVPQPGIEPG